MRRGSARTPLTRSSRSHGFGGHRGTPQEYDAPYHGILLGGEANWWGKVSLYRFHLEDPIRFRKSIRVTIEHGHANRRSDDYSSTAYSYQEEPHRVFPALPRVAERLPLRDDPAP